MAEGETAERTPVKLELAPGTYRWCACGHSRTQPLCDGSHVGTGVEPVEFTLLRTRTLWLCRCKRTASPPYCDGAHQRLGDDD